MMKKVLYITSILLCILLTACGDDSSIGIIGGADGPTSIIVAEKEKKQCTNKLRQRMPKK